MARLTLTEDWSIELPDDFRARPADGALHLAGTGPRTIWASIHTPPPTRAPEALLDEILQDAHQSPEQRFREQGSDAYEIRYATWYPDNGRWTLNAFTIRRASYIQLAVLTDSPTDLAWSLETWRSLRYTSTPAPKGLLRPA